MSYCVKTGARIWIQKLGAIYSADIYAVGPANLVIRFNTAGAEHGIWDDFAAMTARATHFAFQPDFQKGDWLREDLGVLVTHRSLVKGELCDE